MIVILASSFRIQNRARRGPGVTVKAMISGCQQGGGNLIIFIIQPELKLKNGFGLHLGKERMVMKAIIVKPGKEQPVLAWQEVSDISYGPAEALVEVRATAVNRADLLQARGLYPPPAGVSAILGLEMSGVIAAVGAEVSNWRVGDRVLALLPGGGYAERVAVHHELLLELPASWSWAQGAAVPEVWLTAFLNLFLEGGLKSGQTVLIHAGGSGVGTAGIQMARESGATVFTTAGSEAKLAQCRRLGANLAINYKEQDFSSQIMAATAGQGVDLILDPVGANYLQQNLQILKENGRLVNIGLLGGRTAEINLGWVLGKSLRIIGSRLRSRGLEEKIGIIRKFRGQFWPLLKSGKMQPVIDRVFPITEAQAAHAYVRENRNTGKVILAVEGV
jgi:tumor protein p53-inducible protein 3